MNDLVKGIYFDLLFRVSQMKATLQAGDHHRDVPGHFINNTIKELSNLEREVNSVIQSGDLDLEFLSNNNLTRYNTFYQSFQLIELFRFRVIQNFGKPEAYLNKKINKIYDEIGNFQTPPIITTISNSEEYFWVHPSVEIIALPIGEENRLLNLPDLYHEVGHLIFNQYRDYFIKQVEPEIKWFYDEQIQKANDTHGASDLLDILRACKENWMDSWLEEFTCDIIATYLVSSAYAWTNMKLTTISGVANEIFLPASSHPSDEARNRTIIKALQKLDCPDQELRSIKHTWETFLDHISNDEPDYYEYFFPDELLEPMVTNIIDGCKDVYLFSYGDQKNTVNEPISKVLNDAWKEVLNNPSDYSRWEEAKIQEFNEALHNYF